jgi:hypothetical protein
VDCARAWCGRLYDAGGSPTRLRSRAMPYAASEARQQLLDTLAEATDALGFALACLAEAYEKLDEVSGDRLEEQLFQPVQLAYGRAKATHAEFARRHGVPARPFEQGSAGVSPRGAPGFVDQAVEAVAEADRTLAELQDSMLPVEAGDPELRAGLTAVRERVRGLPGIAREFLRTLGR